MLVVLRLRVAICAPLADRVILAIRARIVTDQEDVLHGVPHRTEDIAEAAGRVPVFRRRLRDRVGAACISFPLHVTVIEGKWGFGIVEFAITFLFPSMTIFITQKTMEGAAAFKAAADVFDGNICALDLEGLRRIVDVLAHRLMLADVQLGNRRTDLQAVADLALDASTVDAEVIAFVRRREVEGISR